MGKHGRSDNTGRFAAIDVGSNTVRALAAELVSDGRLQVFADAFKMTALGRGLSQGGGMPSEAIAETADFVAGFLESCGRLDEVYCVGTAAAREAGNTAQLHEALEMRAGLELTVLSGAEEARLTFLGAISSVGNIRGQVPLVADVGGRSTELAVGAGEEVRVASVILGARGITEEYLHSDPPGRGELMAARRAVNAALSEHDDLLAAADVYVAAGGTACSAGLLAGNIWDLSLRRLQQMRRELCIMPLRERRRALAFDPPRAEVICGGLVILELIAAASPARRMHISIGGIREGILLANTGARKILGRQPDGAL